MKNIFLTSAIIAVMSYPAIALDANNHIEPGSANDCVESTLGTATGPANLEADWTANTINLEWYNEDTKLTVPTTSNTCRYDGQITLPSTNPTKTGYTFRGWQVRVAQCLPSDFNYNNITESSPYGYTRLNGEYGDKETDYGLTVGSGEWAVDYGDAGVIKGMAKCSAKSGNHNGGTWNNNASSEWSASESELTSASGETKYCWCQITGYDADKDKNYCPVASPSWVFNGGRGSASGCAASCASFCAGYVRDRSGFRAALFGQVQ